MEMSKLRISIKILLLIIKCFENDYFVRITYFHFKDKCLLAPMSHEIEIVKGFNYFPFRLKCIDIEIFVQPDNLISG